MVLGVSKEVVLSFSSFSFLYGLSFVPTPSPTPPSPRPFCLVKNWPWTFLMSLPLRCCFFTKSRFVWRWGLKPRPHPCQTGSLPAVVHPWPRELYCLHPHICCFQCWSLSLVWIGRCGVTAWLFSSLNPAFQTYAQFLGMLLLGIIVLII